MTIKHAALHELPQEYHSAGTLDLTQDLRILLIMNILGLALFFIFGWFFIMILTHLRPQEAAAGLAIAIHSVFDLIRLVVVLLLVIAVMIVLHEGAHGIFFALFTRHMPVFGLRIYYAYASAPGWYFPRGQYMVTCLAPFILITAVCFWGLAVLPPGWFLPILALMVLNASGSVGDLMVAAWLLSQPRGCLALDQGDVVSLFISD
jgi:hypothetical protein